jgi:hypothetical protein
MFLRRFALREKSQDNDVGCQRLIKDKDVGCQRLIKDK